MFNSQWGPNIIDLTGMDVPVRYIWSKRNFKKKWMNFESILTIVSAVCSVYNHSS